MASSHTSTHEHLRCILCTEVFQAPKTLQCFHTFCHECLNKYIKQTVGISQTQGIHCPACKEFTPVPHPNRPVSEWAEQLRANLYIVGRIQDQEPKEKVCSLCKNEGKTTPGSVWCIQCDSPFCAKCHDIHSRMPRIRSHEFVSLTSMSWDVIKSKRLKFCEQHEDKPVDLFCLECDAPVCQVCCSVKHRKCDIISVADAGNKRRNELEQWKNVLTKYLEELEEEIVAKKNAKALLGEQKIQTVAAIKECQEIAIVELTKKADVLIKEAERMCDREIAIVREKIKSKETQAKANVQAVYVIDHLCMSGSDHDVVSQHRGKHTFQKETIPEEAAPDLSHRELIDIKFETSFSEIKSKMQEMTLGKLTVSYNDSRNRKYRDAVVDRCIVSKFDKDKRDTAVTDVTLISAGGCITVVATDFSNRCVKSFYTKKSKPSHSRLVLDNGPWSVTKLTLDKVAVTVTDAHKIYVISVTPDLKYHSTIKTEKRYCGLSAVNSSILAVSTVSESPNCVDLVDLSGQILRSISRDIVGHVLFSSSHYLFVMPDGDFIVSDWKEQAVTCVTQSGAVRFRCKPGNDVLRYPEGVTCDDAGNIFVVDNHLNKVIQLSKDGEIIQDGLALQNGLDHPLGICHYSKFSGFLYITQYNGDIKVVKFN